tara:strand:+ start:1158 stop:1580 length:423 start_codon:yes stop_codon:yes gene_type:complete
MENFTKTIAEVKSALDQATQMLEENQTLREEIQSLKASPNTHSNERDLKVLEMAFKAGRDQVLGQLRNQSYETTHEIDESTYSDGFEITYTKEVNVEIDLETVLDYIYKEELMDSDDLEKLQEEISHTLTSQLENETVKI